MSKDFCLPGINTDLPKCWITWLLSRRNPFISCIIHHTSSHVGNTRLLVSISAVPCFLFHVTSAYPKVFLSCLIVSFSCQIVFLSCPTDPSRQIVLLSCPIVFWLNTIFPCPHFPDLDEIVLLSCSKVPLSCP